MMDFVVSSFAGVCCVQGQQIRRNSWRRVNVQRRWPLARPSLYSNARRQPMYRSPQYFKNQRVETALLRECVCIVIGQTTESKVKVIPHGKISTL